MAFFQKKGEEPKDVDTEAAEAAGTEDAAETEDAVEETVEKPAKKRGFRLLSIDFSKLFGGKKSASKKQVGEDEEDDEAEESADDDGEETADDDGEEPKAESKGKTTSFAALKALLGAENYNYEEMVRRGDEFISFEELFKISKISSKGPSIDKVVEYLEGDAFAGIPLEEKKAKIAEHLKMEKINPKDLLADADRKDKALDTYEAFIVDRTNDLRNRTVKEIQALSDEIKEKQRQMEAKRAEFEKIRSDCSRWLSEKSEYERRLADACEVLGNRGAMTEGLVTQGAEGKNQNARREDKGRSAKPEK